MPSADLRTLTFIAVVVANLGLVLVNRTIAADPISQLVRPNRSLVFVTAAASLVLAIAVLWAPARSVFEFGHFHLHDLGIVISTAVLLILILDVLKRLRPVSPVIG
jgi:Ca2+-transporting ATPase